MEEISMLKYIKETPGQVRGNILNDDSLTNRLVDLYCNNNYRNIWIVACGSSYNAALCARYLMHKVLKVDVKVITPYTFNNYENDCGEDDFVMCISQSGCSTNAIESLNKCKEIGRKAIGLTGNLDSDFKDIADEVIDFNLGEEKMDFVTKGVVVITSFMMLFALRAALRKNLITNKELGYYKDQMLKAIDNYEYIVENFNDYFNKNKMNLLSIGKTYLIGCGSNYGTVLEGAVKIGETVHVLAVGYEVEEAIHGPQIQLTPDYNFVFIDANDKSSDRMAKSIEASGKITNRNYVLSNNEKVSGDNVMRVPTVVDELVSPLYTLAFVQMLAYTVASTNNTWKTHPLFEDYKSVSFGKTNKYHAFDGVKKS